MNARLLSLFAFLAGVLAVPAFAPFGQWYLLIPSLLALYALLEKATPKQAALRGFCYALGLFLPGQWWIRVSMVEFGGLPIAAAFVLLALLAAYLALYPTLACWLFARLFPRPHWSRWLCAFPVLWVGADWLRGWMLTGYPWLWFGYTQIDAPLKGIAPLFGVAGITLAIMLSVSALWTALRYRQFLPLLVLPPLLYLAHYGITTSWVKRGEAVNVALVQGNIAQSLKWNPDALVPTMRRYQALTNSAKDAQLIIWPEAAVPAVEREMAEYLSNFDGLLQERNQALLTGIINYDYEQKRFYNTVIGLGQDEANSSTTGYSYQHQNRYYKYHLLPIGEFVPFGDLLRPIAPFFNLPMSSFSRGKPVQPNLRAKGLNIAPAICYEIVFADEVRRNVTSETDLLLTVSNDAWFGASIGPWQHMEIARMRSLELARPLLRVTNNGITLVTDSDGSIVAQLPQFEEGVLRAKVQPARGVTPYQKWGDGPLYLLGLLLLGLAFWLRPKAEPRWF